MTKEHTGSMLLWVLLFSILFAAAWPIEAKAEPFNTLWTFQSGGEIRGAIAIDHDGNVCFQSDDGYLYALDPAGNQKWKKWVGQGTYWSSPSVSRNNDVYFCSPYLLYAFSQDGTKQWEFRPDRGIISSNAIGPDGVIYFGTEWKSFYAINPDGSLKWKVTLTGHTGNNMYIPPAIAEDGTIYTVPTDILYALNPDGSVKWTLDLDSCVAPDTSFALGQDGTIYFGTGDGFLHAVNPDGRIKWAFDSSSTYYDGTFTVRGGPAIGTGGTVYFPLDANEVNGGRILGLSPEGEAVYTSRYSPEGYHGGIWTTPALGSIGAVYFGDWRGRFYSCSDTQGNYARWVIDTGADRILSSPAVDDKGRVYFGDSNGTVYCVATVDTNHLAETPWPRFGLDNQGTQSLAVASSIDADFRGDPVTGYSPLEVSFTDLSTGTITSWSWDFGDGETSTEQNPTHLYTAPGTYTIALTVSGAAGSDTETKTNYITVSGGLPVPDIKVNESDGPVTISAGSTVSVTIALDPGKYEGQNADWWVAAHTPFASPGDWYTYVYPTGWQTGIHLCAQTPLFVLDSREVLNTSLPAGSYTFYFAVDDPDGAAVGPWWRLDSVEVHVE